MSDLVEENPLAVVREIRRRVQEGFDRHGLRRIQAIIADDNPRAVKLMRQAGFEVEGLLRAYSPDGKDCFILGRLKWK
jgi:RimJ/RimL family protein N-acetyltransferase